MIDPQTTAAFWDTAHAEDNQPNLTGSHSEEELRNTRATALVTAGRRVLNIGVGLGHTTAELIGMGCLVSIHDISAVALKRFEGRVEGAYLPAELERLPDRYFDVALSHLVIQHMNDEALIPQTRHVVRSLKTDGVFAFQFATAWDQEANSIRHAAQNYDAKPYCRTLARITEIAEAASGAVTYAEVIETFPQYRMSWYAAHVRPANGLPGIRHPNALYPPATSSA